MGGPIRWSVSVDEETDARGKRLHSRIFSIIRKNRSLLVQLVFEWAEFSGFTPETVTAMMMRRQGITSAIAEQPVTSFNNSSQQFPSVEEASPAGRLKPLTRTSQPPARGVRQRAIHGVSRRTVTSLGSVASVEAVAYKSPFLSKLRSIHFSRSAA